MSWWKRSKPTVQIPKVHKLIIDPEDWIILTYPGRLSREEVERLAITFKHHMNHDHLIVLDSDPSITVIHEC